MILCQNDFFGLWKEINLLNTEPSKKEEIDILYEKRLLEVHNLKAMKFAYICTMKRFSASYKIYFGQRFYTPMNLEKSTLIFFL